MSLHITHSLIYTFFPTIFKYIFLIYTGRSLKYLKCFSKSKNLTKHFLNFVFEVHWLVNIFNCYKILFTVKNVRVRKFEIRKFATVESRFRNGWREIGTCVPAELPAPTELRFHLQNARALEKEWNFNFLMLVFDLLWSWSRFCIPFCSEQIAPFSDCTVSVLFYSSLSSGSLRLMQIENETLMVDENLMLNKSGIQAWRTSAL